MKPEVLVQTRLPRDVAEWVAQEAGREGVSVAAWVRRQVLRAHDAAEVPAWTTPAAAAHRQAREAPRGEATFVLVRDHELAGDEVAFRLHRAAGGGRRGAGVGAAEAQAEPWYADPAAHRFLLAGSGRPWSVVRTLEVERGGPIEVVLRIDPPGGSKEG